MRERPTAGQARQRVTRFKKLKPSLLWAFALIAPAPNDVARNLVDRLTLESIHRIAEHGLNQKRLTSPPWSGWYWPLNEGGLSYRYADPDFPSGQPWGVIERYLRARIGTGPTSQLSPAEKYDLLVGDPGFGLSRAMLRLASDSAVGGSIEAWLGFCTGWANASMMLPRPVRSVFALAADGTTWLEFRPSDIKALGTLLWANGSSPARIAGSLCPEAPIRRDPVTGRALNPLCQDTNPATFHLALINQVGVTGRSFLIDSDPGYQIWNQPVLAYQSTYFNPKTEQPASLEEAIVALSDFPQDRFRSFRDPGARKLVGIETTLTFVYEKRPSLASTDSPDTDELRQPVYRYDLELDQTGKIIGGEWHSRLHPDLLWVAPAGTQPKTAGDADLNPNEDWSRGSALPPSWITGAATSKRYGQPLKAIVEKLFALSSEAE